MRTCIAALLVTAALAAGPSASLAQQASASLGGSSYPRAWISGSIGVGSGIGDGTNGSLGASVNFELPSTTLLGQIALNGNWSSEQPDGSPLYAAAASLAPGYGWASDDLALAGFAGPALTWGRGEPGEDRYLAAGVSIGGQFFVTPQFLGTPAQFWGLGIDLFANLNPEQSSFGVRFAFLIGKPR